MVVGAQIAIDFGGILSINCVAKIVLVGSGDLPRLVMSRFFFGSIPSFGISCSSHKRFVCFHCAFCGNDMGSRSTILASFGERDVLAFYLVFVVCQDDLARKLPPRVRHAHDGSPGRRTNPPPLRARTRDGTA